MESVLFTKLFRGMTLDEIADSANDLGFDGIDLLIRQGHQVAPDHPAEIAGAVQLLREAGFSVPMATTDITDPGRHPTEAIFAACADAGIKVIRLGYWTYDPALGYRAIFEGARRDLQTLASLARGAGVTLALQLHGKTIHSSGAQALALLQDHDLAVIGAYPDPGNQVVQEGRENWRFTFDALAPWLVCVGVKNGGWFPGALAESGQRHWTSDWLGLSEGMVPWDEIFTYLGATGFDGLLSFHSHYEAPFAQVMNQTRLDLDFARQQLRAATFAGSAV
jgi:sugar phosphate isomerase/epimerase